MLLQDKRVKSEQAKYESFNRQRNAVLVKYRKVYQAFNDLIHGLMNAQSFYSEMKDTADSLEKNVETFVSNRRSEGAQLLHRIEQDREALSGSQADRERDRLQQLMDRMVVDPSITSPVKPRDGSRSLQTNEIYSTKSPSVSPHHHSNPSFAYSNGTSQMRSTVSSPKQQHLAGRPSFQPTQDVPVGQDTYQSAAPLATGDPQYNPMAYPYQSPTSPPPPPNTAQNPQNQQQNSQFLPRGYMPPPPPPRPPPNSQGNYGNSAYPHPSGPGGYAQPPRQSHAKQPQADPWAGLNAWK